MAVFTDTFDAPDGTTLASRGYTVGQFVNLSPAPAAYLHSNRARFTGATPYALRTVAAGDVTVRATWPNSAGASYYAVVLAKYIDQNNYVYFRQDGCVRERVAGVSTETNVSSPWMTGMSIEVEVVGDVFRYRQGGALVAERTRTGFAASTLSGLGHGSADETNDWDDLSIVDTASAAPGAQKTYVALGGGTIRLVRTPDSIKRLYVAAPRQAVPVPINGQLWPRGGRLRGTVAPEVR